MPSIAPPCTSACRKAARRHRRLARRGAIESFVEIELKAAPMLGAGGAEGLVLILHDVRKTHRLLEQMSWQASHDPLTGLPNRTAFGERLRSLLEGARTAGERHALLDMDDEAMSRQVEQLGMASSQIQLAVRESRLVLYARPLKPLEDFLRDGKRAAIPDNPAIMPST